MMRARSGEDETPEARDCDKIQHFQTIKTTFGWKYWNYVALFIMLEIYI